VTTPAPNSPAATYQRFGRTPVTVSNTAAGLSQLVTGIGLITSIQVANPSPTTPAVIFLLDGSDTTAPVLSRFAVPVSGSEGQSGGISGIYFGRGLYIYYETGFAYVSVTYVPLTEPLR